jgi:hypothetical protein
MKYKYKILNSIWFILILIVNQNLSASEKFTPFKEISQNTRLISIEREGLLYGGEIKSPLHGEIPNEINVSKYEIGSSVNTSIIQSIKTNQQGYYSLEGDVPGGIFFYIIFGGIGGIIGGNIARFLKRRDILLWSVIGGIGCVFLGAVLFEPPVVALIIDNASDERIILEIDSLSPTTISAHSQVKVKFIQGVKSIRTVNASDKSEIEHFDLQITDQDKYYIYNVAALNEYTSHQATYIPER